MRLTLKIIFGPRSVTIAMAMLPAIAFSLTATDAVETAYKAYKKDGVVSEALIIERVAALSNQKADCNKPLNQLAFDSLSPEHQQALGSNGIVDSLGPVAFVKDTINLVRLFSGGMTDSQQAQFALETGRGAAIRYRTERCCSTTGETMRSADNIESAAKSDSSTTPPSADSGSNSPAMAPAAQKVTGIDGWEGDIVGSQIAGSKFEKLKIGMTIVQVVAELGHPDAQKFSSSATNAFAFTKFGPGRYQSEYLYKSAGRLDFITEDDMGLGEMRLKRIIHRPEEAGKF